MDKQGTPHSGVLYRGATGELWFLRDDWDHPKRIDHAALKERATHYAGRVESEDFLGHDLPEDLLDILNDLFGPLIGAWWVWGP